MLVVRGSRVVPRPRSQLNLPVQFCGFFFGSTTTRHKSKFFLFLVKFKGVKENFEGGTFFPSKSLAEAVLIAL